MAKRPRTNTLGITTLSNATHSNTLITVIGGSGFIGRHLVRSLAKRGYRVRVACRRPDLAGHTLLAGSPGQIVPVQANVRFPASLDAACEGASAVINLTGILYNAGGQSFDAIHGFGAEASAAAAKRSGAKLFIQMSALGADANSAAEYARTKAAGEAGAQAAFPGAIVIRPSVVFGPDDNFFNQFAKMARFAPALPLVGGGETKFQPVFVGDVAEAIATLVDRGIADGKAYELGGPDIMSFRQVLDFVLKTTQRKRLLVPLPWGVSKLLATVLGLLPSPALTTDQVELLRSDNVIGANATNTFKSLGITPRSVASIVPDYLFRFRKAGQFTTSDAATP
jgi:uncharacterized protein YbjT (DUF2867 family)